MSTEPVKRYSVGSSRFVDEEGQWVAFSDYDALSKRAERLEKALGGIVALMGPVIDPENGIAPFMSAWENFDHPLDGEEVYRELTSLLRAALAALGSEPGKGE